MPTWQIQTTDGASTRVEGSELYWDDQILSVIVDKGASFMAPLPNLAYVKRLEDLPATRALGNGEVQVVAKFTFPDRPSRGVTRARLDSIRDVAEHVNAEVEWLSQTPTTNPGA